MLIARLIAGSSDWETQLHSAHVAFATAGVSLVSGKKLGSASDVIELRLADADFGSVHSVLNMTFGNCDALVARGEIKVPSLFVSDMDSTMIGQECIDELADYAGLKDRIADITERAMQGELDFESALRERVGLLEGLDESAIAQCLEERISPMDGAMTLVSTLKAHGCRCVLVTGGFHHFGDRVAEWLDFDRVVGNRLGVAEGKLTGLLDGPISDANTKLATLREEAERLPQGATILASGDGANDIPMIEAADYGFAFRAKPKARAAANGRIDKGDLTNILSLLGIDRKDWVEA